MNILIITGMSGAGKSLAVKCLEDIGYYCVDNMPPGLIVKFAELFLKSESKPENIAMVMDIRSGDMLSELLPALQELAELDIQYKILFLEASDRVLINRYKESRRMHPLAKSGDIEDAIAEERLKLQEIKNKADYVIDTTDLSTRQFKFKLTHLFYGAKTAGLMVNIISFGFKYGLPPTCDLVFDVRFLPNPYYVEDLKHMTGLSKEVSDYVLNSPECQDFLKRLYDFVSYLLPLYIDEGKSILVIGIGCTGGKHRSVTIAECLKNYLQEREYPVTVDHRDIFVDNRDNKLLY